jgi:nucleoside-diphosphate-sugar epimerase
MKILVTGGNGFLGSRLLRYLGTSGHELISLQRSDPMVIATQTGVRYVQTDLANRAAMMPHFEGVDVVFHVAAKAGMWGPWEAFFDANVTATENVLDACVRHGVGKLIYTSTPSVVFTGQSLSGADESLPYGQGWLCHYAHTKAIAESMVLSAARSGVLSALALRPHLIWGAGDPHLLPKVIARARAGRLRIVGDGNNRVDLTHVENAAHAHVCALRVLMETPERVNGKAYFISDDAPLPLWEWINGVLQRLGMEPVKRKVAPGIAYAAASLMEGMHRTLRLGGEPTMTRFVVKELSHDHFFNITAAKQDLAYHPIVDSQAAMDSLIDYLKE